MKIPALYRKFVRGRARAAATFPDRITRRRREILFGDWHGSKAAPDAQRKYGAAVAKWIAHGQRLPGEPARLVRASGPTVAQVASAYFDAVTGEYGDKQLSAIRCTFAVLVEIVGNDSVDDFGPLRLKEVRDAMIVGDGQREPWSRTTVNRRVAIVVAALKWAAEHDIIGPEAHARCATVKPLRTGRSAAAEPLAVLPVADADVAATLPFLPPPVRAMVQIQAMTGARPGEVCAICPRDIDFQPACVPRGSQVWLCRPAKHKTAWKGKYREIWFGPEAQDLLRPYLSRQVHRALFAPTDAVTDLMTRRRAARVTPAGQGNEPGTNRRAVRVREAGERYTVTAYARAITRAVQKADAVIREGGGPGVSHWHPNQLRHSYATRMRAVVGIEATSAMLGHASVAMTEVYAERDRAQAAAIAEKYG